MNAFLILKTWKIARKVPWRRLGPVWKKSYHANTGVFGFRPKNDNEPYKVPENTLRNRAENSNLYRLVEAYREYGHKEAQLDPLGRKLPTTCEELKPSYYGLSNERVTYDGLIHCSTPSGTVLDAVTFLRSVYCGSTALEFQYIQNMEERDWLAEKAEKMHEVHLTNEEKKNLLVEMLKSQVFDNYVATKFATVKRYGGEGAEGMMGFFIELFRSSAENDVENVVLGMAHRGRLNLLTGLLQFPPVEMFQKMKGMPEFPPDVQASGDVLSHLTSSVDLSFSGKNVHVTMLPNPSHLEAVNPVIVGKARSYHLSSRYGNYSDDPDSKFGQRVIPVQIHGDAAVTGQGIIMETLTLASVPHFDVGGSIHLIVNNQLGFTTPDHQGRTSRYCSDIAKMIEVPVIHVNADHPEDVVKATRLALGYRQKFGHDVFIDLICFRLWGHNELDDPTFTNPHMYEAIRARKSAPDLYAETLIKENVVTKDEVTQIIQSHQSFLSKEHAKIETNKARAKHLQKQWSGLVQAAAQITKWDTGIDQQLLKYIGTKSVHYPDDFNLHPHLLKTFVQTRLSKLSQMTNLDWATAEILAVGSLLYQGFNVRLSGQDVGRGTFSHRHAMLVDQKTSDVYVPVNSLMKDQKGFLEVANSPLSEEAVLGFEYGMSVDNPNNLIIWEAQFGDFFNGAQIIIDTFISAGETKWLLQTGLVMLLPHGYDGAGPEHSSCHIERFLQLCDSKENGIDGDNVNMHIVHPTTPAQYFHLLRRQILRNFRKPLIVAAPKILLRLPQATSSLEDMSPGKTFQTVLSDKTVDPSSVNRIVFCSGKHYYALDKQREAIGAKNVAIVRLEALCPFPTLELQGEMKKYPKAKEFIWSQEEHQNMGAWFFVKPRFENLVGCRLNYVGRGPLATPAVGVGQVHKKEAEDILKNTFAKM